MNREIARPSVPRVRAVERAVAILSSFTPAEPWLNLTAIATRTGLDKVTTSRLLATLVDCGLVRQDPASRGYALTHRLITLAGAVPGHFDLQELVEPVLRDLSLQTECLSFLSTFGREGAICLARATIDPPIRVQLWNVGEGRPYNQGAAPRLLFAHLPREIRDAVLSRPLPKATPVTIVDPDRLRADAEALHGQTAFIARDDIVTGLSGAAHLIHNGRGDVIGAVSVSGLSPMFAGENGERQIACLKRQVAELERRLAASKIHWLDFFNDRASWLG